MQFSEVVAKKKPEPLHARREVVRDFLGKLFSNGVSGRSVGRKLSALRHFYKYLLLDRRIQSDPTLDIDSPKQWKILPKSLAGSEIDTIQKAIQPKQDTQILRALAQRDFAIVELLYASGMRVSELIGVRLEDLKLELGHVLVRGKGDKERIVPLGRAAQEAIQKYMEDGRKVLLSGRVSSILFVRRLGGRLSRQRVWQMLNT